MDLEKLGKYEIKKRLGHGTTGTVFLAFDTKLHKDVAIKVINVEPELREQVLDEARLLDRLKHPNGNPHIVSINTADIIDGYVVIDLEYVEGKTLRDVLDEHRQLPIKQAVEIAAYVLEALAFAHARQIHHGDVKPANVLISCNGIVKLTDFSNARPLGVRSPAIYEGTPPYMAPEAFSREMQTDFRSDVWSVGVMLYEMLAGFRPFRPENGGYEIEDWEYAVNHQTAPDIDQFVKEAPPPLKHVLNRAIARNKGKRFSSSQDFYTTLIRTQLFDPPLSIEEHERSSAFMYAFNRLERYLREKIFPQTPVGMKDVVLEYARQNPSWHDETALLKLCKERNELTHEATRPRTQRRLLPSEKELKLIQGILFALDSTVVQEVKENHLAIIAGSKPATMTAHGPSLAGEHDKARNAHKVIADSSQAAISQPDRAQVQSDHGPGPEPPRVETSASIKPGPATSAGVPPSMRAPLQHAAPTTSAPKLSESLARRKPAAAEWSDRPENEVIAPGASTLSGRSLPMTTAQRALSRSERVASSNSTVSRPSVETLEEWMGRHDEFCLDYGLTKDLAATVESAAQRAVRRAKELCGPNLPEGTKRNYDPLLDDTLLTDFFEANGALFCRFLREGSRPYIETIEREVERDMLAARALKSTQSPRIQNPHGANKKPDTAKPPEVRPRSIRLKDEDASDPHVYPEDFKDDWY